LVALGNQGEKIRPERGHGGGSGQKKSEKKRAVQTEALTKILKGG